MIDVDAIKMRVQSLQRHAGVTDYASQVIHDALALVAEVEQLRAHRGEAERERAAVVAYLRGLADDYGVCIDLSLAEQADIIERGEHRREGDE